MQKFESPSLLRQIEADFFAQRDQIARAQLENVPAKLLLEWEMQSTILQAGLERIHWWRDRFESLHPITFERIQQSAARRANLITLVSSLAQRAQDCSLTRSTPNSAHWRYLLSTERAYDHVWQPEKNSQVACNMGDEFGIDRIPALQKKMESFFGKNMKRQRRGSDEETPKLVKVPLHSRDVVARIGEAFVQTGGTAVAFSSLCSEAGFSVPPSSLSRWRANIDEHGNALPGGGNRGRPRALDDEQTRRFVGFILFRNANNLCVALADVRGYICDSLLVDASESAVHNWLKEQGFTSQKMKRKSGGYKLSRTEMTDMAFEWLKKEWRMLKRGEIWCIDCTFLGHRLDTFYSYAPAGSPQPLLNENVSRFTNLAIGAISSLGRCYGPAVMTYNQKARRDRNPTAKRVAELAELDGLFLEYGVDPDWLVYIGKDKHETRVYVAANASIVRHFMDMLAVEPDHVWLSDGGKEFFTKSGSNLEGYGVIHRGFESAVHQYLSTCDNNWFGAAKRKWRSRGLDYNDDIRAAVAFLADLGATQGSASEWFNRNLQLDRDAPCRESVAKLIGEKKVIQIEYYRQCLYEYCIAENKDARGLLDRDSNDGLDGRYWQNE